MNNINETLIPKVGVITDVRIDTPDIKTFRVVTTDGKKAFDHKPGQCAMLSIPGVGEAMFSITSSPTNKEFMEFSIKKCGCVTTWLHQMEVGQQVTLRGPYGNGFDLENYKGKELFVVAGGTGLSPVRGVVDFFAHHPEQAVSTTLIAGFKSPKDVLFKDDFKFWKEQINVIQTVDTAPEGYEAIQ